MKQMKRGPARLLDGYARVAALWVEAGAAFSLDAVESMLEVLIVLQAQSDPSDFDLLPDDELTIKAWQNIRNRLTERLHLPASPENTIDRYIRTPGLIEQTRRALESLLIGPEQPSEIARSLLDFVVLKQRGANLGEFKLPSYLAGLFGGLLEAGTDQTIYCPFDSSGWLPLLLAADGLSVRAEVQNLQTARIMMLFARFGRWDLQVRTGDAIHSPAWQEDGSLRMFDHATAVAAFGFRQKDDLSDDPFQRFPVQCHYGEAVQLAQLIAQSKGRTILVVPEGFLFRTSGGERNYKEYLLRRGWVDAVVRLPRGAFAPTNIHTSLLIVDKSRNVDADILFVDGTDGLTRSGPEMSAAGVGSANVHELVSVVRTRRVESQSASANPEEITANDFNLSVDRYVRSEGEQAIATILDNAKTVELGDVAEIIRPQVIPVDDAHSIETFGEVGLANIQSDGTVGQPSKTVSVSEKGLAQASRQELKSGDLLLSVRGRIGAVGLITDAPTSRWVASQAFVIVRLRPTSPITSLVVLYRYLVSPLAQGLLKSLAGGTTVPSLQMADVRRLRVMLPSPAEQRAIQSQHEQILKLRAQIAELEKRADELNENAWPMGKGRGGVG